MLSRLLREWLGVPLKGHFLGPCSDLASRHGAAIAGQKAELSMGSHPPTVVLCSSSSSGVSTFMTKRAGCGLCGPPCSEGELLAQEGEFVAMFEYGEMGSCKS
mmetsp:Transcript_82009/g.227392  ORF Transcript_82009/g.227392 Transcript_82009/m.227392 type:complete len:103 (-) Transcript_82009:74-382(-)